MNSGEEGNKETPNLKKRPRNICNQKTSPESKYTKMDMGPPQFTVGSMSKEELKELIGGLLDVKLAEVATKQDVLELKGKIEILDAENTFLKSKIKQLEESCKRADHRFEEELNRSKRNNLIFRGLKIVNGNYLQGVKDFCREILNVQNEIYFNRAHPIGRRNKEIILTNLPRDEDISQILTAARKYLRGTNYSIHRDYTQEYRKNRGKLFLIKKELKKQNCRYEVKIINDFMIIDGQKFNWHEEKGVLSRDAEAIELLEKTTKCDLREIIQAMKTEDRSGKARSGTIPMEEGTNRIPGQQDSS